MSSPQLENGYTPIANELLEALFQSELSRCEYQIVLAIIRKTYGYHKKMAELSNSQLALMTGIDRRNVGRTIRALSEKNILLRGTDTNTHTIGLNKQYKEWFLPKLPVQLASRPIKTDVMVDVNITESDVMDDVELLADDYKNIPDFLQTDVMGALQYVSRCLDLRQFIPVRLIPAHLNNQDG